MDRIIEFVVSGMGVAGIRLRESVAETAIRKDLKGQVRNRPDGTVEVLFLYDENDEGRDSKIRECFIEAISDIKRRGLIDDAEMGSISMEGTTYTSKKVEESIRKRNDFVVIKESDSQEMIWLLEESNRLFLSVSEKSGRILYYKKEKIVSRLESVKKELRYMQADMANIADPVCLKQFISDPLMDFGKKTSHEKDDLMEGLIGFYHDFVHYKRGSMQSKDTEAKLLDQINVLQRMIDKESEKLKREKY